MFLKDKTYKNPKLRQAARDVDYCMHCGKPNDGTIIGAHYSGTDSHKSGKGMGQKSRDSYLAYLCFQCHEYFDNYHEQDKLLRQNQFYEAIIKSHEYLMMQGKLNVC